MTQKSQVRTSAGEAATSKALEDAASRLGGEPRRARQRGMGLPVCGRVRSVKLEELESNSWRAASRLARPYEDGGEDRDCVSDDHPTSAKFTAPRICTVLQVSLMQA